MRVLCVVIPRFPLALELARRPELQGAPVIIGGAPEERKLVIECAAAAERAGIERGMALREALARCPTAIFIEARPRLYTDVFAQLCARLTQHSPLVEAGALGCAYLDLTGLPDSAFPDGEAALARTIHADVQAALGLRPRIGVADTRFAAWLAALRPPKQRDGASAAGTAPGLGVHLVPPGDAAAFIAALPVARLPLSDEMQRRLRWFGARTAGELAAWPRAAVAAQFGPEGAAVWDLAHGVDERPFVLRAPPPAETARLEFAPPVSEAPAVLAAVRHLLGGLLRRAAATASAVRTLTLTLWLGNGHTWERAIVLHEPTADRDRLLRVVAAKLDGVSFPAAITMLDLALERGAETAVQANLFATRARERHNLSAAVERLRARFGQPLIMQIVGVEPWSRLPERRYALIAYEPSMSLNPSS